MQANELVFCGESEEDLMAIEQRLVDLCRRRGVKVNAYKSKVIVMNGLECVVHWDVIAACVSI